MWVLAATLLAAWQAAVPHASAQAVSLQPRRYDFYILLDNSSSIKGGEQMVAREAAELLVSLAGRDDRLVFIAFGRGARVVAQGVASTPAERARIRRDLQRALTFQENRSDITAALAQLELAARSRRSGAGQVAVLVSDGQLFPDSGAAGVVQSYTELRRIVGGLRGVTVSTIGLASRTAVRGERLLDPVRGLGTVTGESLLREVSASTAGQYRRAADVNELVPLYVELLKQTKGISEVMQDARAFRADAQTRSVSVVVVKRRAASGEALGTAGLVLVAPGGGELRYADFGGSRAAERIEWDTSAVLDVVTLYGPRPGAWRVNADAIVLPDNPLELAVRTQPSYVIGTSEGPAAEVRDRRSGRAVPDVQVRAQVDRAGAFSRRSRFYPMSADGAGRFVLPLSSIDLAPGAYRIRVVATSEADSGFYRSSTVLPFQVGAAFLRPVTTPSATLGRPGTTLGLSVEVLEGNPYGGSVAAAFARVTGPRGDVQTVPLTRVGGDRLRFEGTVPARRGGTYRVLYRVEGEAAENNSPRADSTHVETLMLRGWWWDALRPWVIALAVLLTAALLAVVGFNLFKGQALWTNPLARPRLQGSLTCISHPDRGSVTLTGRDLVVGRGGIWLGEAPFLFRVEGADQGAKFRAEEGYFEIGKIPVFSRVLQDRDVITAEADGTTMKIRYSRF